MLAGTRSWPSDCDLRLPDTECPGEGPFYWHCLTWIPVWIGNHMPSKVWDGFTYPFPTLPSSTVEVWEWINTMVNTGLVNGVLTGGTKPSLVPMLTYHEREPLTFTPGDVFYLKYQSPFLCLKFARLKSQPHLPHWVSNIFRMTCFRWASIRRCLPLTWIHFTWQFDHHIAISLVLRGVHLSVISIY